MFSVTFKPIAKIADGMLIRRVGPFSKKQMKLCDIQRVVGVSRDAVTHDEILVGFFDSNGDEIWISEFDVRFRELMRELPQLFPGIGTTDELEQVAPFERAEKLLWRRS